MVWLAGANIVARFPESPALHVPYRAGQTASALLCLSDQDHPTQCDDVLCELEHETLSPEGDADVSADVNACTVPTETTNHGSETAMSNASLRTTLKRLNSPWNQLPPAASGPVVSSERANQRTVEFLEAETRRCPL